MRLACARGPAARGRRRGFSLLEMLVVIVALGILIGLLATTLLGIVRVEGGSRAALDRLSIYSRLADQFRDDVAQAEAAPQQWQTHTAGPACLILHMPGGQPLVYLWEANQLVRMDFQDPAKPIRTVMLARGRGDVAFEHGKTGDRLLKLRITETHLQRDKKPATHTLVEVAAALGGAQR
ncbi:MAG TPA: type II secretion system protein [Gemmataceae bacterium]|nr:type II secretion system protein [Gemmataceae bacterium]